MANMDDLGIIAPTPNQKVIYAEQKQLEPLMGGNRDHARATYQIDTFMAYCYTHVYTACGEVK